MEVSFVTYLLMNACAGITRLLWDQSALEAQLAYFLEMRVTSFPREIMSISLISYHNLGDHLKPIL